MGRDIQDNWRDVLTALEEDRPVAIAGEDGRNTIELICAIL